MFTDTCVHPAWQLHSASASPKEMVRCTASHGTLVVLPLPHWMTPPHPSISVPFFHTHRLPPGRELGAAETVRHVSTGLLPSRSSQSRLTSWKGPGLQRQEGRVAPCHTGPMTTGRSQSSPGLPGMLTVTCDNADVNISHSCDRPEKEPASKTHVWASLATPPQPL